MKVIQRCNKVIEKNVNKLLTTQQQRKLYKRLRRFKESVIQLVYTDINDISFQS